MSRKRAIVGLLAILVVATAAVATTVGTAAGGAKTAAARRTTATPIQHLVVIFQENVSFDHYFGTYPNASNTDGQKFAAAPGTPAVDGLTPATDPSLPASLRHASDLTATNPNSALPVRLDSTATGVAGGPGGQLTCDQDHNYSDEQQSFDGGLMDQFVQSVGTASGTTPYGAPCQAKTVMDYYDGNAVTALWNYAQHNAMSDNSYGTTFGPSAPGAINLASGDTGNVDVAHEANNPTVSTSTAPDADVTPDGTGGFSLTSDAQPYWDDCSTRDALGLTGANIGDRLNGAGLSWGWFEGGFRPTTTFAAAAAATGHSGQSTATFIPDEFSGSFTGKVVPAHASNQALCDAVTPVGPALGGTGQWGYKDDYIPHHEPFQYYASTANPHHLTIATGAGGSDLVTGTDSLSDVGTDTQTFTGVYGTGPHFDTPNHNYDTSDFDQLVAAISAGSLPASALPAVVFLKAPGYQDGHAAYSNPADEQAFVTREINALEKTPDWSSTAVIVNYDDSDGWYDHAQSGVTNPSLAGADNLTNTARGPITAANPTSGQCGAKPQTTTPLGNQQGRCGLGPRLPLLVVSPFAKANSVDHNLSDQASIINFIEYNWRLPAIPGSFDQALAGTDAAEGIPFDLAGLFDFSSNKGANAPLQMDPATGQVNLANADLSGQNLHGDNLSGAELTNANLLGTNLKDGFLVNASAQGANLGGAKLTGANLSGANLTGATLTGANATGANLTGAVLVNAHLQNANLNGANLTNANLTGASLAGANTNHIVWSNTTCPDGTNSNAHGNTCVGHL